MCVRLAARWSVATALGLLLLVGGAPPAAAGVLKPRWRYVGEGGWVLVGSGYVFLGSASDNQRPGGTVIDEKTGKRTSVVPPTRSGYLCDVPSAFGGPWLAFECVLPASTSQAQKYQLELYRIPTRDWLVVPQAVDGPVEGVGADWIEYWAAQAGAPQPQFVFQNIESGQTRTLPGWRPGGQVIPDLNSPALGRRLCAPLRIPDAWSADEDWPGTVSIFGSDAVLAGADRTLRPFGYLQKCGTRMRRWIGPLGTHNASANSHAVVWQPSLPGAPNLHGAYLPSLTKFTVDTKRLVDHVGSPYTGQNTYSAWLTSRTLYVLVQPYYPADCTLPEPCLAPPSQLYATAAPRRPKLARR